MRASWCLYPWDVLDNPALADRVAASGAGTVRLAAAYHGVRAATPTHPRTRVVAAQAALYVPVREQDWDGDARDGGDGESADEGLRLRPQEATAWTGTSDSFGRATAVLRERGLRVEAWCVLTHSSVVGRRQESVCVRNAFGDVYPYALCPSNASVRRYALGLVRAVVAQADVDGLVVEAAGPLGVDHAGLHEKTGGADWDAADRDLLSVCLCQACADALRDRDVNPSEVAAAVRAGVGAQHGSAEGLLGGVADAVLDVRRAGVAALRGEVLALARSRSLPVAEHARPGRRRSVQQGPDHEGSGRWVTGPALAVDAGTAPADVWLAQCWDGGVGDVRALREMHPEVPVEAYVTVLGAELPRAEDWEALLAAGAGGLTVYHAGLASRARFEHAAGLLADLGGPT